MSELEKAVVTKKGKSKSGGEYSIKVCVVEASLNGVTVSSELVAGALASVIEGAISDDEAQPSAAPDRLQSASLPFGGG